MAIGRIDREPARGYQRASEAGRDLSWTLDVVGEYGRPIGQVVLRVRGDASTGRLMSEGVRLVFPGEERSS